MKQNKLDRSKSESPALVPMTTLESELPNNSGPKRRRSGVSTGAGWPFLASATRLRSYGVVGLLSCAFFGACGAPNEADPQGPASSLGDVDSIESELNLGLAANGAPWGIYKDLEMNQLQYYAFVANASGYRITSLSAYEVNGSPRFNAVYEVNGGGDWRVAVELSAAQLDTELQNARNDNFRPVSIDAYRSGSEIRYTLLLTDNSSSNRDWFVRRGLTASQYQTDFNANSALGYRPEHITGHWFNNTSYYTAIWIDAQEAWTSAHGLTASQYQTAFTNNKQAGLSLVQVDGHSANGAARYSAIWIQHPDLLTSGQHGHSWSKFDEFSSDQRRSGFRPLSVDTFGSGANATFAAAWRADVYPKSTLTNIDTIVRNAMSAHSVTGLSLALTKNGQLKLARGYGNAINSSFGSATPANSNTRFRWASVSKPITSALVLKLVEQGQLSLSAPVFGNGSNGLLSARYPQPYAYDVSHIQVRDLLEHTSGGWSNASGSDPMSAQGTLGQDALVEWVLDAPQHAVTPPAPNQPKTMQYSNFGYVLLGRIVEEVTHQTYEQAAQQLLFTPAGASSFAIGGDSSAAALPNEARYYNALFGPSPYAAGVRRADAAGGWVGTPTDLLRLMVRIDGRTNPNDLISATTFQSMTTLSPTCSTGACNYAKGWGIEGPTGTSSGFDWTHNGGLPGTRSLVRNRADGISWAVVINDTSGGAPYLADGAMVDMMNSVIGAAGTLPNVDLF